ncbi:unnamed protein product [Cuscuta europaea]|uniref:Uncharacterized protein n=1 Tax=Cuscuta europaea TaxID=41803 RepID=A0A9P0Z6T6_CUSEU|nr:unnamed protein product [Cuscuta europaea]
MRNKDRRAMKRLKLITELMEPKTVEAYQRIRELMARPLESFGDYKDEESDSPGKSKTNNLCWMLQRAEECSEYMDPINEEAERKINELLARPLESFDIDE